MSSLITTQTFGLFANPNNAGIISELEKRRANILKFPLIEAAKIALDENSIEIVKNLAEYDWIIFTDVLAVDFFLETLEENGIDFFELDETRVCAVGEAVSDRLRFVQLHADVIPNSVNVENVLSSLKSYAAAVEFADLKFLIVKEISLANRIGSDLVKADAKVSELPIYRLRLPSKKPMVKLKTLLKGGAIDRFVFSAATDFIALQYIFDEEPLNELLAGIEVSAADGQIAQTLREHDLKKYDLFRLEKIDTV